MRLSFAPGQKRFGVVAIAELFASLMTDVLGYRRFATQGGDWAPPSPRGSPTSFPNASSASISISWPVRRDPKMLENGTAEEKAFLGQLEHFLKEESGYQWIQGTKPTTLAFGLTDSPAGLAAWIVEKFHTWTDCDGNIETAVTRDEMLTDIMLYWATGAIGSSFWPYYDRSAFGLADSRRRADRDADRIHRVPKEILRPPRSVAERLYANIQRWTVMEKGGHFAALEQPEALARGDPSVLQAAAVEGCGCGDRKRRLCRHSGGRRPLSFLAGNSRLVADRIDRAARI